MKQGELGLVWQPFGIKKEVRGVSATGGKREWGEKARFGRGGDRMTTGMRTLWGDYVPPLQRKNTFFLTTYEIRPSVWGHCLNSSQRNNMCEGCPLSLYWKECTCVPGPGLVKWACTSSNDTERPWPKFLGPMGITRRHHVTFHIFYKNGWIYKLTALREIHAWVLYKTPASGVSSWWCQPQAKAH